jgi:uncharacterized repeat protein (TIGR03803 family)
MTAALSFTLIRARRHIITFIRFSQPHGRLTLDPTGTTLYGMTRNGGSLGYGIVFSVDTSGNNYQVLHDFTGDTMGTNDGGTSDHGYVVQLEKCSTG